MLRQNGSHAMANFAALTVRDAIKLRTFWFTPWNMSEHVPDRVDRAIVAQLQRDGRMANVDLADAVGLSPSACLRRVRALEADGIIAGYRAEVSRAKAWRRPHRVHRAEGRGALPRGVLTGGAGAACHPRRCRLLPGVRQRRLPRGGCRAGPRQLRSGCCSTSSLAIPSVAEARSTFAIRTIVSRGPLPLRALAIASASRARRRALGTPLVVLPRSSVVAPQSRTGARASARARVPATSAR